MKPGELGRVSFMGTGVSATWFYRTPNPNDQAERLDTYTSLPRGAVVMFLEHVDLGGFNGDMTKIIYKDRVGWFLGVLFPVSKEELNASG